MKTIYKYQIQLGAISIDMPRGAQVLAVQAQREHPQIWVLCDPDEPVERRHFSVFGTGELIVPDGRKLSFCGTFQLHGGSLVFHVFEAVSA